MSKVTFRRIATIQVLIVAGIFVSWWIYRSAAYLSTPIGSHDEYYAHTWGFQGMVGVMYLVGVLAFTAFIIVMERWIYGFFESGRNS